MPYQKKKTIGMGSERSYVADVNSILSYCDQALIFIQVQFSVRTAWDWCLFLFPLALLEIPRYTLPAIVLALLRPFGYPRDDSAQRAHFMKLNPRVSALLVGFNEEASVTKAIDSLLELNYTHLEIIVIDDCSTDRMYELAKPYADRGEIKLWKNTAASGRSGRPSSSNLALHFSTGDYIISVDADTSFDRNTLMHMIGPFYDSQVGVVAGNIKVRNVGQSIWADMQAIEYLISIGLWKRWLNVLGMNMQASGAFGAFRRETLEQIGGWDPELAEDADLSLKAKKSGWKIIFSPYAIAMTNAPHTLKILAGQRVRWDKGAFRTYYRKHINICNFRLFGWKNMVELFQEFFFSVFCTMIYPVYIIYMLVYNVPLLIFALGLSYVLYVFTSAITLGTALMYSERRSDEWTLMTRIFIFPWYKGVFRWIRLYATCLEIFHIHYDESYLPQAAWRNTPRW